MLSLLLNVALLHFFGLLSPGPDFFYVSRTAASRGMSFALAAIIGISLGVTFWALASVLGLTLLFEQIPLMKGVVLAVGGAYLIWLGSKMLKVRENVSFNEDSNFSQSCWSAEIRRGLWVNLSNAKAIAYFASVMSMLLAQVSGITPVVLVIALILAETFLYFCLVGLLFSRPLARQFYSRYSRYIDNIGGAIFTCFGVYLFYCAYLIL